MKDRDYNAEVAKILIQSKKSTFSRAAKMANSLMNIETLVGSSKSANSPKKNSSGSQIQSVMNEDGTLEQVIDGVPLEKLKDFYNNQANSKYLLSTEEILQHLDSNQNEQSFLKQESDFGKTNRNNTTNSSHIFKTISRDYISANMRQTLPPQDVPGPFHYRPRYKLVEGGDSSNLKFTPITKHKRRTPSHNHRHSSTSSNASLTQPQTPHDHQQPSSGNPPAQLQMSPSTKSSPSNTNSFFFKSISRDKANKKKLEDYPEIGAYWPESDPCIKLYKPIVISNMEKDIPRDKVIQYSSSSAPDVFYNTKIDLTVEKLDTGAISLDKQVDRDIASKSTRAGAELSSTVSEFPIFHLFTTCDPDIKYTKPQQLISFDKSLDRRVKGVLHPAMIATGTERNSEYDEMFRAMGKDRNSPLVAQEQYFKTQRKTLELTNFAKQIPRKHENKTALDLHYNIDYSQTESRVGGPIRFKKMLARNKAI